MEAIRLSNLLRWCTISHDQLPAHPDIRVRFRICADSREMGRMMARELVDEINRHNEAGEETRAILPCGPSCWYGPFAEIVNTERISLTRLHVFHMDECLDWQGRELPRSHPLSFHGEMERRFYNPIDPSLEVPEANRHWLVPETMAIVSDLIQERPIDITFGGWGQDGHVAYNQARRHPFSRIDIQELYDSTIRIQENNIDTIVALAHRNFGGAYQFVPPMSITLGMKECLSSRKVRLWSDTGSWKQTALRVALFSEATAEYPITLLQNHPDAIITATVETARHPLEEHPEWDLGV